MSDAPIYERLARRLATNPLSEGRRPVIINDEVMTAPLTQAQEEAMRRVEKAQHEQAVAKTLAFALGIAVGATSITIARAHAPAVLWWLFSQGDK